MSEKSPVLRLSQKELTKLFESGEAKIVCTGKDLVKQETNRWKKLLGEDLICPIPEPPKKLFNVLDRAKKEGLSFFEPHFFMNVELSRNTFLPGTKSPIPEWFWNRFEENMIDASSTMVSRKWVLIDKTPRPDWNKTYENDPLAPLIEDVRRKNKLAVSFGEIGSRQCLSWDTIKIHVLPELARQLRIDNKQVTLPSAVEFNILTNMCYPKWQNPVSWEWMNDPVIDVNNKISGDPQRLIYGNTLTGGAESRISFFPKKEWHNTIGFRPMIVFLTTRSLKEWR